MGADQSSMAEAKATMNMGKSRLEVITKKSRGENNRLENVIKKHLMAKEAGNTNVLLAMTSAEMVIRNNWTVEACAHVNNSLELLTARWGLLEASKAELPFELLEPVHTIIWASSRLPDAPELVKFSKFLTRRFPEQLKVPKGNGQQEINEHVNHVVTALLNPAKKPSHNVKVCELERIATRYNISGFSSDAVPDDGTAAPGYDDAYSGGSGPGGAGILPPAHVPSAPTASFQGGIGPGGALPGYNTATNPNIPAPHYGGVNHPPVVGGISPVSHPQVMGQAQSMLDNPLPPAVGPADFPPPPPSTNAK